MGKLVNQVTICRDAPSVRIVAPDPRKRRKGRRQGLALLDAVAETMPHYPLDAAFVDSIPPELVPYWREWRAGRH